MLRLGALDWIRLGAVLGTSSSPGQQANNEVLLPYYCYDCAFLSSVVSMYALLQRARRYAEMGASDSKLVFKQGIFKLSEDKAIAADDEYWTGVCALNARFIESTHTKAHDA